MFENKNILFVYSCLEDNLKTQQSIVFIKQFIEKLPENCNITILTTTDELTFLLTERKINIIQNRVCEDEILKTINENNINFIIPICGDKELDKTIKNIYSKLKSKKVEILQESYYIEDKTKKHFNVLAKNSGFSIYRNKKKQNRQHTKEFFVSAIKDYFGNQIILDFCDVATINSKDFIISPSFCIENDKKKVLKILQYFGEKLNIINVPYVINFSISQDGKIYFDSVEYGFTEKMIFSIQSKNIDITDIVYKNKHRIIQYYNIKNNYIAYTYNYSQNFVINFSTNYQEIEFKLKQKNIVSYSNNCLVYKLLLLNHIEQKHIKCFYKDCYKNLYLQTNNLLNNSNYSINERDTLYGDKNILVFLSKNFIRNTSEMICFLNLCQKLKEKTNNNIILITEYFTPLINLVEFKDIFIFNDLNNDNIIDIIKHFNIKQSFLYNYKNNKNIIELLYKNDVKIYGLNYEDTILFNINEKIKDDFCNKIGYTYKEIYSNENKIFDFYCIKDKHNNYYADFTVNDCFFNKINSNGIIYPASFDNFYIHDDIYEMSYKILSNIKSSGIVKISYIYDSGFLFVNDINIDCYYIPFLIHNLEKNTIFDILTEAIIGSNIDVSIRKHKIKSMDIFYQKILFNLDNNKTISLDGLTQEKVIKRYKMIFDCNSK